MYRSLPSAAQSNLPVARQISHEVICLPMYPNLEHEQVDFIVSLIIEFLEDL
jgi:dTDP-4-amino-4,6-dideoxygalactose transaminase